MMQQSSLRVALSLLLALTGCGKGGESAMREGEDVPLAQPVESTRTGLRAPAFPAVEELDPEMALPDPFRFIDGRTVEPDPEAWTTRRAELGAAIQHYEIGPKPPPDEVDISAAFAGGQLTVVVTRPENGRSVVLTSQIHLPAGKGPHPAVIVITPAPGMVQGTLATTEIGTPTGLGIPNAVFDERGIARIDFYHDQITSWAVGQGVPHDADPYFQLYPEYSAPGNVGQYSAWIWGISRLIDGLEIAVSQGLAPLAVDLERLGITGCSYAGKMALFAGAFDERISLTMPQESGGGGIPAWRVSHAIEPDGDVEKIDNTNYNWFRQDRLPQFSGDDVYRLPHDHHELMAMVAPRALLVTGNTDMLWLSNRSGYIAARAAEAVYERLGVPERFGFHFSGGYGHCVVPEDLRPVFGAYLDRFLLGKEADTRIRDHAFEELDYWAWMPWAEFESSP